ncbi:DUF6000 family protein [Streptomyces sp. CEV 2-1]|uniref:DUF6000 family protein n=1 Tax=Streptomyces sp. CEV 2-1 TaxID=2485153 RepID=UPI0037D9BA18
MRLLGSAGVPSWHSRQQPSRFDVGGAHLFRGCGIPVPIRRRSHVGHRLFSNKQAKERAGLAPQQQGKIGHVIRDPHDDAELLALVCRYVTPGRRYLKLSGSLLRMEDREHDRFMHDLREDAGLRSHLIW